MPNSKPHSEVKQYRVKECQNCEAKNIVTVPDAENPVVPVCPKCNEHPGTISSYGDCPHNPVHTWQEKAMCLKAQAKTCKRAKQVFSTGEIPHLWAHKVQASARNPQRNLYFENGVIYSYGAYFPIAAHVEHDARKAILVTTRKYSVTTAGHVSQVRGAIPSNVTVFNVPHVLITWHTAERHALNVKAYLADLAYVISKAQKARQLSSKRQERAEAKRLHDELLAYCKFFRLARPKNIPELPKLTAAMVVKIKAREAFLASPEHKAKLQAQNAKKFARCIENWRAGTGYFSWKQTRNLPTMLRINGNEIETSQGARVPVDHAKRVLAIVRRMVAEHKTFETNGHTIPIGVYKVDRIDADGTLHAGCHHIPYAEIERIGVLLDAMQKQA